MKNPYAAAHGSRRIMFRSRLRSDTMTVVSLPHSVSQPAADFPADHTRTAHCRVVLTGAKAGDCALLAQTVIGFARVVAVLAERRSVPGSFPDLRTSMLPAGEGLGASAEVTLRLPCGVTPVMNADDLLVMLAALIDGDALEENDSSDLAPALESLLAPVLREEAKALILTDADGEIRAECGMTKAKRALFDAAPVQSQTAERCVHLTVKRVPECPEDEWRVAVGRAELAVTVTDQLFLAKTAEGGIKRPEEGSVLIADIRMRPHEDGSGRLACEAVTVRGIVAKGGNTDGRG